MGWFTETEYEKLAERSWLADTQRLAGIPSLDARGQHLYGKALPRGVLSPRLEPDRAPVNFWMRPGELMAHSYVPGQILLGKLGQTFLGHLDDRPMITMAGARAGKTSTVLEPNIYLYPGSMLVLDPKCDLAGHAALRRALGHDVYVLDPFGQSGEGSACFNPLSELDPTSPTIIDDVSIITHAIIVDDGDAKSKHWNDSARTLLRGIILLTLRLPENERNLISVREFLTLSHRRLLVATEHAKARFDEKYFKDRNVVIDTLFGAMARATDAFGGVLASIGRRFQETPPTERGSIFSTAAAQTDFLDSLPLRDTLRHSSFRLSALRSARPTTLFLCLPVGRMQSHYRWLRMLVQMSCLTLERMGTYPRGRTPILFMMEEFATLGHMEIMERAAAYFPGFGIKLWAVLQDLGQLERYYPKSANTLLGNAGLIQCFANNDKPTLDYIAQRSAGLIRPFELRTAFSRKSEAQILLMEGEAPAAALRLDHRDVEAVRSQAARRAQHLIARAALATSGASRR